MRWWLNGSFQTWLTMLLACSAASCSSCSRHDASKSQPDPDGPLPLPPTSSPLQITTTERLQNMGEFALPSACSFVGPAETLSVPAKRIRLVAPMHATGELAMAHEPPEGLGPAPVRGIVSLSDGRSSRDLPWFELDAPPWMDRAGEAWIAAFDAPSVGSRRQAVLARGDQPFERIAAGDQLRVANLACDSELCAILTTRAANVASPGASLFIGSADAPAATWARTDIDSVDEPEAPLKVLAVNAQTAMATIALGSSTQIRVVSAGRGKVTPDSRLASSFGAIDVAITNGRPVLAAHGGAVDERGCAPAGASIAFQVADQQPHVQSVTAPPSRGRLVSIGGASLFVWIGPVNCLNRERTIVYAQVVDSMGAPVEAPMPVADARDFEVRAVGQTVELFLTRDEAVYRLVAKCGPK